MVTIKDLGKEAEDKVTGFKGIIIGVSQWLTGCNQVCIKPKVDKDGTMKEAEWVDEGQAVIIGEGIDAEDVKSGNPGGPRKDQPKR